MEIIQIINQRVIFFLKAGNIQLRQLIVIERDKITKGTINISFPESEIKLSKQNITIGVYDMKGNLIDSYQTYFEGPFKLQF